MVYNNSFYFILNTIFFVVITSFLSLYIQVKWILRYYSTKRCGIFFYDKLICIYITRKKGWRIVKLKTIWWDLKLV